QRRMCLARRSRSSSRSIRHLSGWSKDGGPSPRRHVGNEPRGRSRPPRRLKLSRRQADDRLLRMRFAIIIAGVICERVAAKIMWPCWAAASGPDANGLYTGARPHIVKGEVDDESWCGLSADRTWRRYRGGQGVRPGG